jgi:hypothetical protein
MEGFGTVFYLMLILGILGMLGFFMVAVGAAGGAL